MAFRLVIAEKPSVAQTIAAALGIKGKQDGYIEGGGYLISWCVGHLVQLAEAAAYGEQYKKWSFDSLPILPEEWQYAVDPDKGKQFKTIKELMHRADVSEVVNACDAGREGELIFRFVYEVAGCKKPMRRLWISSMEDGGFVPAKQKFYGECRAEMPVLTAEGIYRHLLRLDLPEYEVARLQRTFLVAEIRSDFR